MSNGQALRELLDWSGKRVLDVGCGDGSVIRLLTRLGAACVGLDPNPAQLAKAGATEPVGDEEYVSGGGEDLPFPDASFDVVVIFNSLHHIPEALIAGALKESARVLKPGGRLAVFEPVAEGPHFELNKPVDDETRVRALAYDALKNAGPFGLQETSEALYENPMPYADFEAFKERCLRIDPARAPAFADHEAEMREIFAALGTPADAGFTFAQPMRVNLLARAA